MKLDKKGALELSISTIIVIVIGITLLSLGLIFVRGTFSRISDLSDKVFERADRELEDIGQGGKFSIREHVPIEQDQVVSFKVFLTHDGSIGSQKARFRLRLIPNEGGQFEKFVKAKVVSNDAVILNPGEKGEFLIRVAAVGNAPLTTDASYQVIVDCDICGSDPYYSTGFIIDIEEKRGFF